MKEGKIIIISAPSGTGKSTIISRIIGLDELNLGFSVSATSRKPRAGEENGKHYYFLSPEEFDRLVEEGKFVEWEEVYAGTRYGTLEEEVERVISTGQNLIMDIDVKGALNVKKRFGNRAISIFVLPPSIEELGRRLRSRATDSEETIAKRLAKAEYELSFAHDFDSQIINEDIDKASSEMHDIILGFISDK